MIQVQQKFISCSCRRIGWVKLADMKFKVAFLYLRCFSNVTLKVVSTAARKRKRAQKGLS